MLASCLDYSCTLIIIGSDFISVIIIIISIIKILIIIIGAIVVVHLMDVCAIIRGAWMVS